MPALRHATFRSPVDDLRATVGELGDGDVALDGSRDFPSKTQLRTEGIIVTSMPEWLPSF